MMRYLSFCVAPSRVIYSFFFPPITPLFSNSNKFVYRFIKILKIKKKKMKNNKK